MFALNPFVNVEMNKMKVCLHCWLFFLGRNRIPLFWRRTRHKQRRAHLPWKLPHLRFQKRKRQFHFSRSSEMLHCSRERLLEDDNRLLHCFRESISLMGSFTQRWFFWLSVLPWRMNGKRLTLSYLLSPPHLCGFLSLSATLRLSCRANCTYPAPVAIARSWLSTIQFRQNR
jgi:hypothetical protein